VVRTKPQPDKGKSTPRKCSLSCMHQECAEGLESIMAGSMEKANTTLHFE
jgi:hypothetical protein